MTNLETLMLDVTNTLNHNGFNEVKVVSNNVDFSIRVGYWEQIPASLRETMEEYHSIRITEHTWEELVEKFEFLCTSDDVDEDFYVNVLSNRTLYREFKLAKSRLPYLRRALKREPDAGHDVDLEKMLSYIEKYNNLEPFEFEWDF